MKLTVLIDLDDTLLSNNMDSFLKVYLKALGNAMAPFIQIERMIPQLLVATTKMIRKKTPAMTLEEEFDRHFYPHLGYRKEELEPHLLDFYEKEFPKIHSVTERRDSAVELVGQILAKGWDLVIATNPVFPQTASVQRSHWAGLGDYLPAVKTITSFENFHYAKPNPAYYAEILAHFGCQDQPAVMIGNSLSDDIIPAAKLGLPVYWINDGTETLPPELDGRGKTGGLTGVLPWLEHIAADGRAPDPGNPEGLLAILAATPAAMDTFCRSLSPRAWKSRPSGNEWSPTEILCHLRDVDRDVNLTRISQFLSEKNPFLQAVDSDPWAEERIYQNQDGSEALADFIENRTRLLDLLERLPDSNWNLPGRHAIFGPITLKELVAIIVSHDRAHLNQMACTLEK